MIAKEYIEREALKDRIKQEPTDGMFTHEILEAIAEIPAADVTPVVHGRWMVDEYARYVFCSACENQYDEDGDVYNDVMYGSPHCYCQDCGAKMDGNRVNMRGEDFCSDGERKDDEK